MWVLQTVVNGLCNGSTHISPTKQKSRAVRFFLPNAERSHSVLRIWNTTILFSQILEPNGTIISPVSFFLTISLLFLPPLPLTGILSDDLSPQLSLQQCKTTPLTYLTSHHKHTPIKYQLGLT
jgi:hypothetical protein